MNLYRLLSQRAADNKPLRVALIGAGKFGTMFLAQARRTPGIHVVAVADLDPVRAREGLDPAGWEAVRYHIRPSAEADRAAPKRVFVSNWRVSSGSGTGARRPSRRSRCTSSET